MKLLKLYVDGRLYGMYEHFYQAKKVENQLRLEAIVLGYPIETKVI